ncbi:hypothetical protein C1I98_11170 [Spongiactinospora gelatinilytica]|uniref:Uncharacterized protein n=1 Tax=Spongiactinospora gelatinilytica TaxID=2666298 RepID=A0A2W2HJL6_9ACTN|nr:hypothetical protein [Spongiactinospora gelatinilytica]PZG49868.1 hypothetical protein C1I98_11170 [Spongiactinospora gelatinilytica]
MASWTRRERTITHIEYALPLPTNWAEVGKVYASLNQELGERAEWDDAVEVTSDGAELVFRYLKTEGT